jgi:hypothetical protein
MKFSGPAMTQVRERPRPRAVHVAGKEYIMVSPFGLQENFVERYSNSYELGSRGCRAGGGAATLCSIFRLAE